MDSGSLLIDAATKWLLLANTKARGGKLVCLGFKTDLKGESERKEGAARMEKLGQRVANEGQVCCLMLHPSVL